MPDEIFSDTLGSRVKFYRERLGISQDELATRVGAAQQTIQSLEAGKIRKSTFLPFISKELGVDSDTLLFGAEHPSVPTDQPQLSVTRHIPLFSTRDVDSIHTYLNDIRVQSPTMKWIQVDNSLPFLESGSRLFALKLGLSDEVFHPEFRPGDQLVIDPDAPIQPTDPVIIYKQGSERLSLSKYRVLSESDSDTHYELVSIHPDFPSFSGLQLETIEILGPIIQMRRPISSRVRLAVLDQQARMVNKN